jgi:hypothetical protein
MYLGLPAYFPGTDGVGAYRVKGANNAFLKAGQEFDIDPEMAARFKFQKISKGIVPTPEDLYLWIKNAFRNIFNNFGKETDFYQAWANDGLEASEKLLAWSAQVIKYYKGIMKNNGGKVGTGSVPDTMITRLIKLQIEALSSPAKTAEFARMFDCSEADLKVRLADDRIQVNAFGCFVGAVANPEEANARIIDGILRLKEAAADPSKMKIKNGSYAELREACLAANDVRSDMSLINKYALELLRLTPQGEILLRLCVNDTELRSMPGVKFAKGQLIFNAHGAAMRDPNVLDDPLAFDVKRNDQTKAYSYQGDGREKEAPQSVVYLQHGYGRHKCLGRYASEMTMEEVVRAVVRLGDLERAGDLKMYDNNLYAESLKVKVL